jgi:hypothetical protein
MANLFLTIDIAEISKMGLNLNGYLTLMKLHHNLEKRSFPYVVDERFFASLIEDEFIKEIEGSFILTDKGIKIFRGDDLFEEFYMTFPHKVPMGTGFRPVSTQDPNGISAKATRSIWDRITKGKPHLQRHIIDNLKRELAHKTTNNSLAYLHNIDTWLRQATWEKWDDISFSNNKNSSNKSTKL